MLVVNVIKSAIKYHRQQIPKCFLNPLLYKWTLRAIAADFGDSLNARPPTFLHVNFTNDISNRFKSTK